MTKARSLNERQQHLWRSYTQMNRALLARLRDVLASEGGVSAADYGVLFFLSQEPSGVLRARDLGIELGWNRSRLSHHLIRMERRGTIVREECEDDARGLMVRITPAGRRAIAAAAHANDATVQHLFLDLLSEEELDILSEVFDRVLDNLPDDPS